MELKDLKKELHFKWKIQTKPKGEKKGCCVAYIDSRDVQDLLDEVCGVDKWQNEFYEVKGKVFCKIGIKIEDEWIWKSDSGALDESEFVESETTSKGETSDAFKRAAVQWGIGRFLYTKEMYWITEEEYNKNKFKLTDYVNSQRIDKSYKPTETPAKKEKALGSEDLTCPSCGIVNDENIVKHGQTKTGAPYHLAKCECGKDYFIKDDFFKDKTNNAKSPEWDINGPNK